MRWSTRPPSSPARTASWRPLSLCQDKVVGDNDDKITLLEDKYDAKAITGTLTKVKQDNGKSTYNITIENAKYNGGTYNGGTVSYTDVSKDYSDLLYQNVRVLVKPTRMAKTPWFMVCMPRARTPYRPAFWLT